ncbi:E3 ubiquitin-protein ligase ATL6 [Zea mays]|jgi:hypothetical protein|uniref:RING-type E3 ubiquitin transferase n=2 Tax=Zea mays TaxID=4577 RepID=A0A1D6H6J3_MAIZE|nr:E3 ubiquitin-protein ligase ATL41 [Zea mays]PWZ23008.1 E3 ubiquitin-protein ligase ATL6 [Zea mays]|eukprot:XP_008646970.1 E3 ubiquitin-protein ligase RNF38 [Zea mays]
MADCVTRVWALAIATAACVGLPSALVYAIVRIAAARRYGATFALALVLVFWVTISAAYYPRVCADLVPWLRFLRRAHHSGRPSLLVPLPQQPSFAVQIMHGGRGDAVGALHWEARAARGDAPPPYLSYEQQRVPLAPRTHGDGRGGGRMDALPREPPAARAKARAAAGDDVVMQPTYKQQSDGEPSKYCAICLADVDKEEAAKQLPLCLHVFHRHCIDQWLRGHSTCPICRCNAFLDAHYESC